MANDFPTLINDLLIMTYEGKVQWQDTNVGGMRATDVPPYRVTVTSSYIILNGPAGNIRWNAPQGSTIEGKLKELYEATNPADHAAQGMIADILKQLRAV